ncbi:MAG: gamma-glutamyltransferase [Rhodothermales bacterium]
MDASCSHLALVLFLAVSVLAVLPAAAQGGGDREVGQPFATRSAVLARNGIAATSHPLASQIAIDILKKGGTAMDAAIAANAALGLMEPVSCGIGGDLFAIVFDPKTKKLYGYNGSGRSPKGQSLATLKTLLAARGKTMIPDRGALSVSVPGAVDGWFALHDRFGKLPMRDLLAPTIQYAREGYAVTEIIAYDWGLNVSALEAAAADIEETDNYRATYLIDGRAPRVGDVFVNKGLARSLELIAGQGRDAFYKGELADVMDAYMRRIGGPLRKADFESHHGDWVEPVSVNYRGYEVYELPPNGQGVAALQMLNILEGYDLAAMGHNSADYLHVQIEAKKLAFEDRARFYADPDFYKVPLAQLLSKDYAARQRETIRMDRPMRQLDERAAQLEEGDTIYMTVADKDGMMVSLIQSNYLGLGSGLVPDGLGFMFQDRGALFALEEGHPNVYAPGKRPFHTIIPAFVMKDGEPFMSFGVMGGAMQPQGHVQVLANILDFGMNVQEAGDAARYRHDGSSEPTGTVMTDGGVVHLESGVSPEVVEALRARGHTVRVDKGAYGGYEMILRDPRTGVYHGATEMRKDGMVAGY